jgi:hypothetical protein
MKSKLLFVIILIAAPIYCYADNIYLSGIASRYSDTHLTFLGDFYNPNYLAYDPTTIGGFTLQIFLGPGGGYTDGDYIIRFVESTFNDGDIPVRQRQANWIDPLDSPYSGGWGPQVGLIPQSLFSIDSNSFMLQIPLSMIGNNSSPTDFVINLYEVAPGEWYNGITHIGGSIPYRGTTGLFCLYPVPEPSPLVPVSLGLLGTIVYKWRRGRI